LTADNNILPNEEDLFRRLSEGDVNAFTEIFNFYEPRLYPFVLKMTKSENIAEEVVQEVFIKLWTNRVSLARIENPGGYIFRAASNQTITHLRSKARQMSLAKAVAHSGGEESNITEESLQLKELQSLVHEAVEQLPPQRKLIYTLSRQKGLKNDEIAEQLGISISTVKNQLTEALRFIKEQLKQHPGTPTIIIMIVMKLGETVSH
jgi:RNA polymerase sigma-70 factor (ECF subfamily)